MHTCCSPTSFSFSSTSLLLAPHDNSTTAAHQAERQMLVGGSVAGSNSAIAIVLAPVALLAFQLAFVMDHILFLSTEEGS